MAENTEKRTPPIIQVRNLYKVYRVGESKVFCVKRGHIFLEQGGVLRRRGGRPAPASPPLLNMMAGLEKPSKGGDRHRPAPTSSG